MKLPIYMDNHASTPVDPRVFDAMRPYLQEHFGNPASSGHTFGWIAGAGALLGLFTSLLAALFSGPHKGVVARRRLHHAREKGTLLDAQVSDIPIKKVAGGYSHAPTVGRHVELVGVELQDLLFVIGSLEAQSVEQLPELRGQGAIRSVVEVLGRLLGQG